MPPSGQRIPGFSVRWAGFRSLRDTGWLEVKPLTVLIGANSSGKTSVLAPLLLMKQTLRSRDPATALLLKGQLIDLGSYEDVAFRHHAGSEISFTLRWHVHDRPQGRIAKRGAYPPGSASWTFQRGNEATPATLQRYEVLDVYLRKLLRRDRKSSGRYSLEAFPSGYGLGKQDFHKEVWRAIRRDEPRNLFFTRRPVERIAIEKTRHEAEPGEGPMKVEFQTDARSDLYSAIVETVRLEVSDLLSEMYYIGPLRERPRRHYELSGEMPPDVGTRGESAPEILFRWRQDRKRTAEIKNWLQHFGLAEEIVCEPHGDFGFAISMTSPGQAKSTPLIDMGFGVSQLLPLIVQAHYAERSWIVAEQPEIHLNPRQQASLGDLFAASVNSGRGVLLETHSEHLLLRLRRLIAENELSTDDVALYYVERDGDESTAREVPIQEDGHIDPETWPKGFFAEALRESLALADAQAKNE